MMMGAAVGRMVLKTTARRVPLPLQRMLNCPKARATKEHSRGITGLLMQIRQDDEATPGAAPAIHKAGAMLVPSLIHPLDRRSLSMRRCALPRSWPLQEKRNLDGRAQVKIFRRRPSDNHRSSPLIKGRCVINDSSERLARSLSSP